MKPLDRPYLLFDVMETLVSEPFLEVMPKFFGMSHREFLEAKHPTSWIEFELAMISENEYFQRFFREGPCRDGEGLREQMRKAYRWTDGMEALLAELKAAGHEMHALSNYSIWYELIEQALNISRYVSWTFVSCRTGVRKPEAAAYLQAAATLNATPEGCIFIDDRQENVDAARQVGMRAVRFTDTRQLARDLSSWGLLS
ncbi:MAG: HAD-IA family hydrolase [Planctomycetales bacterium]|nr:HAD-IA family hydrolase [Planctomycetales bacterium]NIM09495.1 HAD-IA family hydrolase [Planctomycetales bacterium]NIN08984.1 HAD-IA family hydrolase [Planctomycetales bacterium]NIN78099.1 HAD-IA family hydrolase [Planctomycetales bacterium]NIO35278.1 HAD-IA family hydrolase [Planctomycetales bacterium]